VFQAGELCGRVWDYVIFDEGHVLRNEKTALAKAARQLRSAFRVMLTGTPLQNHVS
jgi:SNF2 family DNA or RNA helicase